MPLESSLGGLNQPIVLTPSTFTSVVLANSPYSWYRCNETSGSVLIDSSGNSRNGTIYGTPSYQQPGFSIDGSHSLLSSGGVGFITSGGPGMTTSAFTMGSWWSPISGDLSGVLYFFGARGSAYGWQIVVNVSTVTLEISNSGGSFSTTASTTTSAAGLAIGVAQYWWLTYDGIGAWNIYINGASTPIISTTGQPITPPTSGYLLVNGYSPTAAGAVDGYFQDILTFGSALSVPTMQAIYNAAI
jgi:hypothetical protein